MAKRPSYRVKEGPFWFTVQQQTAGIVQRFGKFARIAEPGLHMKVPFVEKVAGTVSLRAQTGDIPLYLSIVRRRTAGTIER